MSRLRTALILGAACAVSACPAAVPPLTEDADAQNSEWDDGGGPGPTPADGGGPGSDGGGPGPTPADGGGIPSSFLHIRSPSTGSLVSDFFEIDIAVDDESLVSKGLTVSVDQALVATTKTLPTGPVSFDSTGYSNGAHVVEVAVETNDGKIHRDSVNLTFHNAPFRASSIEASKEYYKRGEVAQIAAEFTGETSGLSLTADFSELDSAYVPGSEAISDDGGGKYTITYLISAGDSSEDGAKEVALVATDAASGTSVRRTIELTLRTLDPAPFDISDAEYMDEPLPARAVDPSTKVTIVSGDLESLIPGVPQEVVLSWTSGVIVEDLYITVRGYSGYYLLPVTAGTSGQIAITVTLPVSAQTNKASATEKAQPLRKLRAAADSSCSGSAFDFSGTPACFPAAATVTNGVGRIVLRWSKPVDLDLFVTEPNGEVISYQNPTSKNGGVLDFDANRNCIKEFMVSSPAESVVWPKGSLAPGQYTVKARLANACNGANGAMTTDPLPSAVSFTGSYQDCSGKTTNFSGTVPAGTEPGALVNAVTYTINGCDVWVHGALTYKKYLPLSPATKKYPKLTLTKVSALKSSDNSVLATGFSDGSGNYSLQFKADSTTKYHLKVESTRRPATKGASSQVEVIDSASKLHAWRTPDLDTKAALEQNLIVVDDALNGKHAGAFNLLQITAKGFSYARTLVGKKPPYNLKVHWANNYQSPVCQTCYSMSAGTTDDVYIGGLVADPDEYDDPVVLHEFYHSAVGRMSHDNSPGGQHTLTTPSVPTLAWSEGIATFLGCYTNGSSLYYDSGQGFISKTSQETWYDKNKTGIEGTVGNSMTGKLSEALVFCALWDLHDGLNKTEPYDKVVNQTSGITDAVFKFMQKKLPGQDRGAAGADFVDFLDGYRCQYYSDGATNGGFGDETALKDLIKNFKYPYDYSTTVNCK